MGVIRSILSIYLLIAAIQNVDSEWGNSYVSGHSKDFLTLEPNFETSTKYQSILAKPSNSNKYFRAVLFITYDDSLGKNGIEQHEISAELFNKLTSSREYVKSSGNVKSTYNTLAFFDGKCDVSIECKPPRIEDCTTTYRPCECTTTPKPTLTTTTTSKPTTTTTKPTTTKPTTTKPTTTKPTTTKPTTTKPTTTKPTTTKPTTTTTKPTTTTTKPTTTISRTTTTKLTLKPTSIKLFYSPVPGKSRIFPTWTGTYPKIKWPTGFPSKSRVYPTGSYSWRTYSHTPYPKITTLPNYYRDDKGNWFKYLVGNE